MKRIITAWDQFWFAPVSLFNLAIFRIILCTTMGFMYLGRQWDLKTYYTEEGILPFKLSLQVITDFYRPFFNWVVWPDSMVPYFHAALVFGLFLLAMGIGGRILNLLVWVLHIAFLQRNYSIAFGADLIGGIFLLLMIGTQSCSQLTVLNLRNGQAKKETSDILTSVFYRMIQVQLCVIYAYTGLEKLKGGTWWDGTALWSVLANPQMVIMDLTWVRHIPFVVVAITFLTILFEIYFPVLVWLKPWRKFILIFGVAFHLGIGFIMALWSFALIMLAPYILFNRSNHADKIFQFLDL